MLSQKSLILCIKDQQLDHTHSTEFRHTPHDRRIPGVSICFTAFSHHMHRLRNLQLIRIGARPHQR